MIYIECFIAQIINRIYSKNSIAEKITANKQMNTHLQNRLNIPFDRLEIETLI